MEFTEAESNMNDLVAEYQTYQVRYMERIKSIFYKNILKNLWTQKICRISPC